MHAHRCGIAIIGENIRADFSGWHWPAEIEALNLIGIGLVKEIDLVESFHAFDSDSHVHFATQRDVSRRKRDIRTIVLKVRLDNPKDAYVPGMTAEVLVSPDQLKATASNAGAGVDKQQ